MSAEKTGFRFEIGHVLFIDIVGYSKLLITEQSELLGKLTRAVLATQQLRAAEAENKLIRLPTGDGMALVFRNTSEVPAQCAAELAQRLKSLPELRVRMGIHSGPINEVTDVNGRTNRCPPTQMRMQFRRRARIRPYFPKLSLELLCCLLEGGSCGV